MQRVAFKMKLHKGFAEEYKKRHDNLWPELKTLLKHNGISEYLIYLDEETHALFGILKVEDARVLDALPENEVMRKWWDYMQDIMETNEDHSPLSIPLQQVFFLP